MKPFIEQKTPSLKANRPPSRRPVWKRLSTALLTMGGIGLCGLLPAFSQTQAPPAPPTFRKCERAGVNFNVCKVCEDAKMTVNCKTYWCQDNGICVEKPLPHRPRTTPIPPPIKTVSRSPLQPVEGQQLSALRTPPDPAAAR